MAITTASGRRRSCLLTSIFQFTFLLLVHCLHVAGQITPGTQLLASDDKPWLSENGTFAFGFTPTNKDGDKLILAIWHATVPADHRAILWSPNRDNPVGTSAVLKFDSTTGNLFLLFNNSTLWTTNVTSTPTSCVLTETGNLILYSNSHIPLWQSFSHPTDTLLPSQPLTGSMQLTSANKSAPLTGHYSLKMLQQPTSLSLALSYNVPLAANYSYWQGPDISNTTGEVIAVLDDAGSFGIVYGDKSGGAVYVYKNVRDDSGLSSAVNRTGQITTPSALRRLTLDPNGNLQLYRWYEDLNGSSQWVVKWAAVSNPCDIAGTCGNGVCNLDKSKTTSFCTCLPGRSKLPSENLNSGFTDHICVDKSNLTGKCTNRHSNLSSAFKITTVQQTNYHFSTQSIITNYSITNTSACATSCLSECECVASVYGLSEVVNKPYCWILKSLDFGGFQDPSATLFVKGLPSDDDDDDGLISSSDSKSGRTAKTIVLPVALCMGVLIVLLCLLLYYSMRRRMLTMERSAVFSGAPVSFSYRDLQIRTDNFAEFLGIGGFGGVYKGRLGDGTLIAVKKLDRILPHGEKEFITEVNTIGSMHHMNLVRLCGYCSEGQHRLLVYEFMKNGSLDKWIFSKSSSSPSSSSYFLDWRTRYNIAIGTAQGIAYFHEQCRDRIIHCDIKPENILLDENFCPKVSDFGLAKLMGRDHSHVVTMVRGTRGYLAPEWISNRPVTVRADVYSYGMLLLEIIGGRRNLDMSLGKDEFFYPGLAYREMVGGSVKKAVDKRLSRMMMVDEEEEVMRGLKVAFWCIQDEVFARPSMGEVVKLLEGVEADQINMPPMPQTVVELIDEGLEQVYRAMRREYGSSDNRRGGMSWFTVNSGDDGVDSRATCSYSTMSPR